MSNLNEQQKAYAKLLNNLVLVDFRRKKVILRGYEMLVNTKIRRALNEQI